MENMTNAQKAVDDYKESIKTLMLDEVSTEEKEELRTQIAEIMSKDVTGLSTEEFEAMEWEAVKVVLTFGFELAKKRLLEEKD